MNERFSPAATIREARERLGLDPHSVAVAAGLNDHWYFDVESYDSDVTSNISLSQLGLIARRLSLDPLAIFEQSPPPVEHQRTLVELLTLADGEMRRRDETVDTFGDTVGWEMAPVLADPDKFRQYTFDALVDLCRVLGVDWREFLLDSLKPAG